MMLTRRLSFRLPKTQYHYICQSHLPRHEHFPYLDQIDIPGSVVVGVDGSPEGSRICGKRDFRMNGKDRIENHVRNIREEDFLTDWMNFHVVQGVELAPKEIVQKYCRVERWVWIH